MAIQNTLQATIVSTDTNNTTAINRIISTSVFSGTEGLYCGGQKIPNADTVITLPVSPVKQVYIRNIDAASFLTIKATPNGGAEATIDILSPGSFFISWDVTGAAQGYTSIKLNQSVASTQVEYFLGG